MALPVYPNAISFNQVNVELGLGGTTSISLNQATVRALFQRASGQISMSDGHGKSAGTPANVLNGYWDDGQDRDQCYTGCDTGWTGWAYLVSGTLPISWQLHMASGGCGNEVAVSNPGNGYSYGTIQVGTTPTYAANALYVGSPPAYVIYAYSGGNFGTYTGGTQYRAAHYRLYVSNSIGNDYSAWSQVYLNYCYVSNDCYCGYCQGCGSNGASYGCYDCSESCYCEPCYYDCSADCVTGYAAVCQCDPGASDWCEPNCPCSPYSCSETCGCPCGESCQYGDYYCDSGCASWGTDYYPDGNCP